MKIVLIRHGSKDYTSTSEDKDRPLSDKGRSETERLRRNLASLDLEPEAYLTSNHDHAAAMGKILAGQLGNTTTQAQVLSLDALTPHSPTSTFEDIIDETGEKGIDLRKLGVVAIVGHEARLSQLLTRLTSTRARPFSRAEAACLTAPLFRDFLQGTGKVAFRIPVVNHQEGQLRPKIASKMTVSTFLAGFTASALFGIIEGTESGFSLFQTIGAICLTAALALFIASVYMYDRMAMPEGFWVDEDRPNPKRKLHLRWDKQTFDEDSHKNGVLYAYMVWTWKYVFSPAIILGLAGFFAILLDTKEVIVIIGGVVVILGVLIYYAKTRPMLGTD